jgi:hypothetical protein
VAYIERYERRMAKWRRKMRFLGDEARPRHDWFDAA